MYRVHTLPTKATKEATTKEFDHGSGRPTRSVEESLVLLQALRQSRQTWLTSAFVKFSTKSRGGKGNEVWQPLHTIRFRGKCDLEIGPHVFYSTSVYEVTYQPYQVPIHASSPYYASSGQRPPGWPVAPHTYSPIPQTPVTSKTSTAAPVYAPSATALVSSLKGAVPVTNDLISQVNNAATKNPTLANLLGLAASGSATPEQLQTLGVTIQSLAETALKSTNSSTPPPPISSASTTPSKATQECQKPVPPPTFQPLSTTTKPKPPTPTAPQSSVLSLRPPQAQVHSQNLMLGQPLPPAFTTLYPSQPPQMQTINKEPDVVIEFYENSYDRWTLPKELVLYERVKRWDGNSSLADIIFSTIFPFEGSKALPSSVTPASSIPAGSLTEAPQLNKDAVHPITLRFFNVPPAIWNLFSKAADDAERTKRVRVAMDAQLDKAAPRVHLQHRIAEGSLLSQLQASATDRYQTKLIRPILPATHTAQAKRRASTMAKDGKGNSAPPPKRKRTATAKKPEPKTGKCEGCLRDPVALVPDTPFCPTCDKAKKSKVSFTYPTSQSTTTSGAKPVAQSTQMQYAGQPHYQAYYAWQNQQHYIYQYQPQPQPQGQLLCPSGQSKPGSSTTSDQPTPPGTGQPSKNPTSSQQSDVASTQEKRDVSIPE